MCGAERRTHVKGAGAGLLGWTHTFIKTKVSGARTSHGDGDGGHRASHGDGYGGHVMCHIVTCAEQRVTLLLAY